MSIAEEIARLVARGVDVRFAQSGDSVQCWLHDGEEQFTAVGETPDEALTNAKAELER